MTRITKCSRFSLSVPPLFLAALSMASLVAQIKRVDAMPSSDPVKPTVALSLNVITNGVATSRDGRIFLVLARLDGSDGARVAEWVHADLKPYPNLEWNSWSYGDPGKDRLVRVNSIRIGPEGDLWLVDVGAPGIGKSKIKEGPKLVRIQLATNTVKQVYPMDEATSDQSFIDDVRFNGGHAYVTDAGDPGIIVLDLRTGQARRILERDHSTTAQKPISAEGRVLLGSDGRPVFVHADQMEVSPDGKWFYFQPCSGPLYRVPTAMLDDPAEAAAISEHVEVFAETTSTGGTAIDAKGNIYVSDTDRQRILKIGPNKKISVLAQDPRLLWVDAMWIDHDGYLWMPAAQLNRMSPFQGLGGVSRVVYPMQVFKLKIGEKPPLNDHP